MADKSELDEVSEKVAIDYATLLDNMAKRHGLTIQDAARIVSSTTHLMMFKDKVPERFFKVSYETVAEELTKKYPLRKEAAVEVLLAIAEFFTDDPES